MYTLPAKLSEYKDGDSVFLLECYIFYLETGNLYLTSADQNITIDGQEYMAVPIQRDKYTSHSDSKIDDCTLHVSNVDDSFTVALYSGTDFRGCNCMVFQVWYPDILTDPTLVKPILFGYLDDPKLNEKESTFEVSIKAQIPNLTNYRTLQLSCNSEFGDQDSCMADKCITTATAQTGTTQSKIILPNSYSDDFWTNGMITSRYESRTITSSKGNVVNLHFPFMFIPETFTIERGCDKTFACCKNIGQQKNYSGFLGVPYELTIRST